MNKGWVKLHRRLLDNSMFKRDHSAMILFIAILLLADKNSGSYECGRFQLATIIGLNPNTTYKALKRLEKAKIVTLASNNKYTVVNICNWRTYQADSNIKSNNKVTTDEQQSNTKQELRIKNKEYNNVQLAEQIERIYDLFLEKFSKNPNQLKLTPQRKIKIKARIKDCGFEMLSKAIVNTSNSSFHMGDNARGWKADIDWILKSYEQVEKLSLLQSPRTQKLEQAIKKPVYKPEVVISEEERQANVRRIAEMKEKFLNRPQKKS